MSEGVGDPDAQRSEMLMSTAALAAAMADVSRSLVVVELLNSEAPARIPGSLRAWRPDYQLPMGEDQPLDGILPLAEQFQDFARGLGVNETTEVVIVDRKYDATRLWWLFVLFGKRQVSVLDGGFAAWESEGRPVTADAPEPRPRGSWTVRPPDERLMARREDVEAMQAAGEPARLWDVRTVEEFEGAVCLPGARRPGRIPWATARLEWDLFHADDGRFRPSEEIRAIALSQLHTTPEDRLVHTFYCQSGVRTTQLIFSLFLAGWPLERLRNYDGSWVEWSHVAGNSDIACGPVDATGRGGA